MRSLRLIPPVAEATVIAAAAAVAEAMMAAVAVTEAVMAAAVAETVVAAAVTEAVVAAVAVAEAVMVAAVSVVVVATSGGVCDMLCPAAELRAHRHSFDAVSIKTWRRMKSTSRALACATVLERER